MLNKKLKLFYFLFRVNINNDFDINCNTTYYNITIKTLKPNKIICNNFIVNLVKKNFNI